MALPSGVWLAQNTGYAVVVAITAVSALAPLAVVPWLGGSAGHEAGTEAGTDAKPAWPCWPACARPRSCGSR